MSKGSSSPALHNSRTLWKGVEPGSECWELSICAQQSSLAGLVWQLLCALKAHVGQIQGCKGCGLWFDSTLDTDWMCMRRSIKLTVCTEHGVTFLEMALCSSTQCLLMLQFLVVLGQSCPWQGLPCFTWVFIRAFYPYEGLSLFYHGKLSVLRDCAWVFCYILC